MLGRVLLLAVLLLAFDQRSYAGQFCHYSDYGNLTTCHVSLNSCKSHISSSGGYCKVVEQTSSSNGNLGMQIIDAFRLGQNNRVQREQAELSNKRLEKAQKKLETPSHRFESNKSDTLVYEHHTGEMNFVPQLKDTKQKMQKLGLLPVGNSVFEFDEGVVAQDIEASLLHGGFITDSIREKAALLGASTISSGIFKSNIHEDRLEFWATYFALIERPCVGIAFSEVTVAERKLVGTNQVIKVVELFPDGPAYLANIFEGDLLLNADDESFVHALKNQSFQSDTMVEIDLFRDGEQVTVTLQTGSCNN